jgi:uncharacterized protein YndB with AHSA1/START domain
VREAATGLYVTHTAGRAPMRVSRSVVLPVPVTEAWRALSDWEAQARWMRDADTVEVLTPQREGVGVRIAVRTRVLGIPAFTEVLEVVRWEPPHRMRLAHRSFVRGHGEWTLRPPVAEDPDRPRVLFTWTEELALGVPFLGPLALGAYRPLMAWLMRGSLRNLQRSLARP